MLSSILGWGKKKFDPDAPIRPSGSKESDKVTPQPTSAAKPNKPIQTLYDFNDVPIPSDFLTVDPPDLQPLTLTPIDWSKTAIPEREGYYAVVLDNVLSPSECTALLNLAEQSVPEHHKTPSDDGQTLSSWGPALVNMGGGFEILIPHYRNSDRIIWDQQEVVDRIWERCLRAPGLRERLAVIENEPRLTGTERNFRLADARWEFRKVNKRMRFLKYGGGQFFKPHCDSAYIEQTPEGKTLKTLFTIHLYLNDSQQVTNDDSVDLVGGATSFLCRDEKRKVDVDPKAGRVLIFQHHGLLHSGDDVKKGIKYTMRSDIVYEMSLPEDKEEENK
ncbi:hypothetical protein QBC37DRAFT_272332 [Rhypophila decipiens]|uniref:Prolyl 4-hydroxylase alpha subunit domain-containing protein n=1 Tax=Rhypophila decipiens TaxID=261697 RepID=A0AAN6YJG1_9PEZI|nr:hypothetical protein QBC37DRAFT_272332 [Rhypophila decipiens]